MKKTYHQFNRILIANRGEIAVRIIKTAKEMGIETVALYTAPEADALHLNNADHKALLIGESLADTYLNAQQIIDLAKRYKAEAIHPGYGFLSENENFAQLCADNNIVFIGPKAEHIKLMGNKNQANKIAEECNIPLLKKINGTVQNMLDQVSSLQFPVVIKAAAGGGGKGMRVVHYIDDLPGEIERASAEAERYFADPYVYAEEYIENPRHIEVQILADQYGNTVHLFERDCSIQRRHQKVIEEAPAAMLSDETRQKLFTDALKLCQKIGYCNAGTLEFLVTKDQKHYFLEMNTRIQVEHPVTEQITGIDIVQEQILIASGMALSFKQQDIKACGHAIEARIYAENPEDNFAPSFGKIIGTHIPSHPHIRIDGGAQATENLNPSFDPLLKKVISLGKNREQAIERLQAFLKNYALFGVHSNREFIIQALNDCDFKNGDYATSFFALKKEQLLSPLTQSKMAQEAIAASFIILKHKKKAVPSNNWEKLGYWRNNQQHQIYLKDESLQILVIENNGEHFIIQIDKKEPIEISDIQIEQNELSFFINGVHFLVNYFMDEDGKFHLQFEGRKQIITDIPPKTKRKNEEDDQESIKTLKAPMPGRIIDIMVTEGEKIQKGKPILILEAMKTENSIQAWKDTTITNVSVNVGDQVSLDQILLETE